MSKILLHIHAHPHQKANLAHMQHSCLPMIQECHTKRFGGDARMDQILEMQPIALQPKAADDENRRVHSLVNRQSVCKIAHGTDEHIKRWIVITSRTCPGPRSFNSISGTLSLVSCQQTMLDRASLTFNAFQWQFDESNDLKLTVNHCDTSRSPPSGSRYDYSASLKWARIFCMGLSPRIIWTSYHHTMLYRIHGD